MQTDCNLNSIGPDLRQSEGGGGPGDWTKQELQFIGFHEIFAPIKSRKIVVFLVIIRNKK
jgi:hypothetical protein